MEMYKTIMHNAERRRSAKDLLCQKVQIDCWEYGVWNREKSARQPHPSLLPSALIVAQLLIELS
eukprot:COSAG02_NODE_14644_length_1251_cov_18.402778_2_plen_64_part_00